MSPVLVTGGTGRLGRRVAGRLRTLGCDVRVLTRRPRQAADGIKFLCGDLATGDGIDAAVDGAAVIVHCATSSRGDAAATRNLIRAASQSGNPHLVYVSIAGVDHLPAWGYPKAKLEAERAIAGSGMQWTILRATQFYDYLLPTLRRLARLPVIPVPASFRVQPVDPDEVAARLVELTLAAPAGHVPDVAGPQETSWAELLSAYLLASRLRRLVLPVRLPGTGAIRAGGLLPRPGYTAGERTWEQFLAANL
jgi:uncharacterized protein YbjT (DUF2867 family)